MMKTNINAWHVMVLVGSLAFFGACGQEQAGQVSPGSTTSGGLGQSSGEPNSRLGQMQPRLAKGDPRPSDAPVNHIASQTPPAEFAEVLLGPYRKDIEGGFSHCWVAYVIKPDTEDRNADEDAKKAKPESTNSPATKAAGATKEWFVELNGHRLGPYGKLGERFEISADGEHIAFVAEKSGNWHIVVDGQDKWTHPGPAWGWYGWSPTLEGNSYRPQSQAAVMEFSPDGKQLAYLAQVEEERWSVHLNGKPGPTFGSVGTQLNFVGGRLTYEAWPKKGDQRTVTVYDGRVLGPYDESWRTHYSRDMSHCCFAARSGKRHLLVVDGKEREVAGELVGWEIAPAGATAYALRSNEKSKVHFGEKTFPDDYDEVAQLTISPDEKHVAFWGRKGNTWSLVTDVRDYPGFDGYYYYVSGNETYCILWGLDSANIAYFARKGKDATLAVNGKEVTQIDGGFPGIAIQAFVDDNRQIVGTGLMGGPILDREAFVTALLRGHNLSCKPYQASLLGTTLAYPDKDENRSFMVVGDKRQGPYEAVNSTLLTTRDGRHYAYVISARKGQQMVLDGDVQPHVYEAIYRPRFAGVTTLQHLGVKDNKLFRVQYPLR